MAADWTTPLLSTLKSSDALALQQIFRSVAQELSRLNAEIESLKTAVNVESAINTKRLR